MCVADDTIEPSFTGKLRTSEEVIAIDGVGAVNQCRRSEGLHEVLVESQKRPLRAKRALKRGDTLRSMVDLDEFSEVSSWLRSYI